MADRQMRAVIAQPFQQPIEQPHPHAAIGIMRRHANSADLALVGFIFCDTETDQLSIALYAQEMPSTVPKTGNDFSAVPMLDARIILRQRQQEGESLGFGNRKGRSAAPIGARRKTGIMGDHRQCLPQLERHEKIDRTEKSSIGSAWVDRLGKQHACQMEQFAETSDEPDESVLHPFSGEVA